MIGRTRACCKKWQQRQVPISKNILFVIRSRSRRPVITYLTWRCRDCIESQRSRHCAFLIYEFFYWNSCGNGIISIKLISIQQKYSSMTSAYRELIGLAFPPKIRAWLNLQLSLAQNKLEFRIKDKLLIFGPNISFA